jgi:hypothetical protein
MLKLLIINPGFKARTPQVDLFEQQKAVKAEAKPSLFQP